MKKNRGLSAIVRKFYRFFRGVFAVIGVLFVIFHLCFDISQVYSDSMAPTLQGDKNKQCDLVLTEKVSYLFRKPRRWEIIRVRTNDELGFIIAKRVVGLIGETVSIKDRWVCINERPLERPKHLDFLKYYSYGSLHRGEKVKCEDGYFVFGDNNKDSFDSRFTGTVKESEIIGRAWLIVWPPSRIGFVK